MKKFFLFPALVLMFAFPLYSQVAVNVFTGLSYSAFEDQEESASAIPLGVAVGYAAMPNLEVGGELNLALPGYGFETELYDIKVTSTFKQNLVGVFGRYYLGKGNLKPFVKGGLGMYFGDAEVEVSYEGQKEKETIDVNGALGFNLGAGVMLQKGFYAEFNYNIVSRKASDSETGEESDSFGMNTWAVQLGYRFKL
ncbi:MAG: porin family protein [candidate division KSB1 bacterium]|nr:porin family protein [candidate division KSB1 bacterium]